MNNTTTSLPESNTTLHGHWLLILRGVWIIIVLLAVSLYMVNVSLGWADLHRICPTPACTLAHLDPLTLQQISRTSISPQLFLSYFSVTDIISVLVYLVVAVFLFLQKPTDGMAILVSVMLVTYGVVTASGSFDNAASAYPALLIPSIFLNDLSNICLALFFYLFPNGRFVPRWTGFLMILAVPLTVLTSVFPKFQPNVLAYILISATYLFAQIYRYRYISNIEQRQQTKWVVFGVAVTLVGLILLSLIINPQAGNASGSSPVSLPVALLSNTAFHLVALFIPISLAMAILRYRLFDIDVIIRRTLVYGVLTAALALIYFGSVLVLQQVFRSVTGDTSSIAIVVSTLAIAALFTPARQFLQDFIDRRFYRRKYDAAQALEVFSAAARDEVELGKLTDDLLAVADETMQPLHISLWLKPTGDRKSYRHEDRRKA